MRMFLRVIGLLCWLASIISCQNPVNSKNNKQKPNVVFIICDDLNDAIGGIGMGGHPQALTPNLDKMINEGVSFSNAQSNCPVCGPSRASLWSGLYPHSTGYFGYKQQQYHWRNNEVLKNSVTLVEHLAANDYQVYGTGKIHHNGHEDFSVFNNKDGSNGFEVGPSFGPYPWDGDPAKAAVNIRGVKHPDLPEAYESNSCWDSFGPVKNLSETMKGKGTWLYNHDEEEYRYVSEDDRDLMPDERCVEYVKEVLADEHKNPFFLAVGFNRPHSPCYVPEKYFDMFPLETLELAPYLVNDLADCAPSLWKTLDVGMGATGFQKYDKLDKVGKDMLLRWTQAYLACVAFVDDQIGQTIEAIKSSPYGDNTIIVVTSDHGYHMGEKEYIFKNSLWEESARVPLIFQGPGVAKGQSCEVPVSLIDIYPTMIDLCGLPGEPNVNGNQKKIDGYSLVPLLLNPVKGQWSGNDYAITAIASSEALAKDESAKPETQHYSIRTKKYRYVLCRNGEEELYDHSGDPYEWKNVAGQEQYMADKLRLKEIIINTCYKNK
ncbi:sulfatase [Carboxylicivirga marina]|uniref:Sulfatase n=1 Tax=Carboxylicivirga marina TaxID=2800988 RepID=A0ABS1HEU2_9BACT|nr:sulfatase [Carboxylicivirga marina]MBK3516067.1 sulfatase [Carboxylicivirga marina]